MSHSASDRGWQEVQGRGLGAGGRRGAHAARRQARVGRGRDRVQVAGRAGQTPHAQHTKAGGHDGQSGAGFGLTRMADRRGLGWRRRAAYTACSMLSRLAFPAASQEETFWLKSMTPEAAAVLAAHAPLAHCHKQGCQVTVAVVDRSGLLQALVRDRFAGAHTVEAATNKAWTAASFKLATAALAQETQAGKPMSGSRAHRMCWRRGGGCPLKLAGCCPAVPVFQVRMVGMWMMLARRPAAAPLPNR